MGLNSVTSHGLYVTQESGGGLVYLGSVVMFKVQDIYPSAWTLSTFLLFLPSNVLQYISHLAILSHRTMSCLAFAAVLGLLMGVGAGLLPPVVTRPFCDSAEAEAAALVAQDYLNGQHMHGYKYVLNQIEDIKIVTTPDGSETYKLEVELLETTCHVLDPTPIANCTVRPKVDTAVEGDCDVILTNVGEVMSVSAFKCKTEASTEDLCLGCATLLPLNDTAGLALVSASLVTFNNKTGQASLFDVLEVGRLSVSSQMRHGVLQHLVEYVIVETNCTTNMSDDSCVPMATAQRGFCHVSGDISSHSVDCTLFAAPASTPSQDTNSTVPTPPASVHVHSLARVHGFRHHKLTSLHNTSGLLSSESGESAESGESGEAVVPVVPVVPVAPVATVATAVVVEALGTESPVVAVRMKRGDAQPTEDGMLVESPMQILQPAKPRCPGRKKFF
ncbi:hypothetical protein DPEC_G00056030 [Dallia pectoralis]|uniref:Uncharacterized protein n=1 Tax=Dallia pectoralis TaxID=75939 RepID=A0ACC2H5H7_DALPE|nr:hypothetical protein DPEC_G00056030 [Dallia pectoralis]